MDEIFGSSARETFVRSMYEMRVHDQRDGDDAQPALGFYGIQAGALLTEAPGVVQWLTFEPDRQGGNHTPAGFLK